MSKQEKLHREKMIQFLRLIGRNDILDELGVEDLPDESEVPHEEH